MNIPQLLTDFIINIANIVILFVILKLLVYKPVKKFLDERKERVASVKSEAQKQVEAAEEQRQKYESFIADSDKIMEEKITEGEIEGRRRAVEIIDSANEKAKEIIADAEIRAKSTEKLMLEDTKDNIADITIGIAEKILGREVTDADNDRLIERFFAEQCGEKNE